MSALILHASFALGGGLGAVARHLLTLLVTHRFPLSTLLVNVLGCFVLGVGTRLLTDLPGFAGEEERRLVFGFCGGFTTFSSLAYQTLDLHRQHTVLHAAINIAVSLVLGLLAFVAGLGVGMVIGGRA